MIGYGQSQRRPVAEALLDASILYGAVTIDEAIALSGTAMVLPDKQRIAAESRRRGACS